MTLGIPETLYLEKALKKEQRKEKRRAFWRSHWYLLLCMLLPAAIMYLIYFARGIHPFGNSSVLVLDLAGQYVWFFEALRNAVFGDASLLYSFSRALGGEFVGIYAYYIASPLSYIVCLFPQDRMLEALLTLFLLKVSICGGTFGYYMHRTLKDRKPTAIIAFSIFYALSAYAIVQQHNTMWIDAVMWLPLITLGIESLIKHGKFKMYTIFLALTLFSNFYIGYMVCFYCAIYFFLYYLAHAEDYRNNPNHEKLHFIKSLLRIAFYSLIALGIAAFIILGAYYALNFGKTTFSETDWTVKSNFDLLDLLYKFLPASYDTVRPEGLPFVYCGVLTLLFLPAYFMSKKYPIRQRIVSGLMVIVFIAILSINVADLIMHGFQAPNWLNYRYSFMLCFYLCVLACRAFAEFESVSLRVIAGMGGLVALLCVFLQKYSDGAYVKPKDLTIWYTLILIFVYLSVLAICKKADKRQLASIALIGVISIETFLSGFFHLNSLGADVGYTAYGTYNSLVSSVRPIVNQVQDSDTSFYRMEKTKHLTVNDNMALEMRGLSGSTSTLNRETVQFLQKMGYASQSHWSHYLGGTPVNDSLLGLKYIISDKDVYGNYYEPYIVDQLNGLTAYYNPYALSIAYGVDDALLDFKLGFAEEAKKNADEEEGEASFIGKSFDKVKEKLNELLGIEESLAGLKYEDDYVSPFERLNGIVTAMLGAEEKVQVFQPITVEKGNLHLINVVQDRIFREYCYTKKNPNGPDPMISYTLHVPVSGEIYFYMPTDYPFEVKLELYDPEQGPIPVEIGHFNGHDTTRIISLGYHEEGKMIALDITLLHDYLYVIKDQPCFYYVDYPVFEEAMSTLAKDQLIVSDYTEDEIHGSFTASKASETVLTTIPFDKGWKIYVDGNEVEPIKALGALIAFKIDGEAGEVHEISLIYQPHTHTVGMTISLISGAFFLLLILLEWPLKRVPVLRALYTTERKKDD